MYVKHDEFVLYDGFCMKAAVEAERLVTVALLTQAEREAEAARAALAVETARKIAEAPRAEVKSHHSIQNASFMMQNPTILMQNSSF